MFYSGSKKFYVDGEDDGDRKTFMIIYIHIKFSQKWLSEAAMQPPLVFSQCLTGHYLQILRFFVWYMITLAPATVMLYSFPYGQVMKEKLLTRNHFQFGLLCMGDSFQTRCGGLKS